MKETKRTPCQMPAMPGLYQHYRGDLYILEGFATDSNNVDAHREPLVVYRSLAHRTLHVRRVSEFFGPASGAEGDPVQRFRWIARPDDIRGVTSSKKPESPSFYYCPKCGGSFYEDHAAEGCPPEPEPIL